MSRINLLILKARVAAGIYMTEPRKAQVKTHNKHIDNTYSNLEPVNALEEIIFNSLDASASKVDIHIKMDDINVLIKEIKVIDNGKGFPKPDENNPLDPFLELGFSEKKFGQTNDFNRAIHGKNGEGRFKSLSLGNIVEWKTKTATESTIIKTTIEDPLNLEIIDNADIPEVTSPTGTVFTAYTNGKDLKLPKIALLKESLERYFLTTLQDKRVFITLNGHRLSVDEHIEKQSTENLPSPNQDVQAKTIIWKKNSEDNNRIFWCDKDYNTLLEDKMEDDRKKTDHSLYIASDKIAKACKENKLNILGLDPELEAIRNKAKEIKEAFLIMHGQQKSEGIIATLKKEEIYPYSDDEKLTETEEQIKVVYDEILIKLNKAKPAVFKASKEIKKNIVKTLKIVIEKDPQNFKIILESLAGLSPEESQDFASLLERVSLSNVIKTSSTIINRLSFIEGLRQIAYGDLNKIKERSQLHKILEKEAWIFGEEFNLTCSDKSFNSTIGEIRASIKGFCGETTIEGGHRIPDLFFTTERWIGQKPYALIVELKRPKVKIGKAEVQQIKDYYDIVKDRTEFANYHIDLIILSSEIDDNVFEGEIENKTTGKMNYSKRPDKVLYIKRWNDVIDLNKSSLSKLKECLNASIGKEEGMEYLNNHHGAILNKK